MTLSQLIADVQARGYPSPQLDDVIKTMVQAAYRRLLGMYRWPFLRASAELNVTAGNNGVNLDPITDLGHLHSVYWTEDGEDYPLTWKSDEEFLAMSTDYFSNDAYDQGIPEFWTRTADNVIAYLPANQRAGALSVQYSKRHELVDDTDEPLFNPLYHDALVWAALSDLAFRERDWTAADRADSKYTAQVLQMIGEYGVEQQQTSREVGSSGFYEQVNSGIGWQ